MANDVIAERARIGWNRRNSNNRDIIVVSNATGDSDKGKVLIESFEAANFPAFQLSRFRGTADAPADVANNDGLGELAFDAYSGAGSFQKASIGSYVDAAVVSGQSPATRLVFKTGLNNVPERLTAYISNEGYFAVGTAFDPTVAATRAAHPLHVVQSGAGTALDVHFEAYEAANASHFHLVRARGTFAAPTNVVAQDNIGRFIATAYSNGLLDTAEIRMAVDDVVVAGQRPASRLAFFTNANNAAARQVAYFNNTGYFGLGIAFDPTVAATSAAFDIHAAKLDSVGRLQMVLQGYGTAADGPYVAVAHARGTFAVPANNVAEDNLGDFEFYAYAGGWLQAAEVRAFVTSAVVNGVTPDTRMEFKVTTGGAMSVRATLFASGRFALGSGSRASEADQTANGAGSLWVAENANITPIAAQFSGSNSSAVTYLGRKSRGNSMSAPTAVVLDDGLSMFRPGAYTGTWFDDGAFIRFAVDAAVVANQRPAMRLEFYVNANNAAAFPVARFRSDGKIAMGDSVTAYVDSALNFVCPSGADALMATFGQNSGGGQNFIIGFATYGGGYTNGHPGRINVIDGNFSNAFRFEHKKTGASSNTMIPSLMLEAKANMCNAGFFSTAPSYGLGQGMIAIANRDTAPSANPSGGGVLYAEAGALKWRGSGGTTTTIANA